MARRAFEYIEQLPKKLDSYPDVTAKASLVHELLPLTVGFALDPDLPEPILDLWSNPPPVTSWIPEVHYRALKLATFDAQQLSDREAMERMRNNYNRLFRNPLYSVLFGLMDAQRMLKTGAQRWKQFHRGTELVMLEMGESQGVMELRAPHPMFQGLVSDIQAVSFEVLLARARGAKDVSMHVTSVPGGFRYVASW